MGRNNKVIISALGSVIIVIFSYIILHEAGHCLVAVFCGAKITQFSILGAHMSYVGGEFNTITYALLHAAGTLLPVVVSFVFMAFYRKGYKNVFYRIFSTMFSLLPFFSLIAWILVPILYLLGEAPENDDVTKFINALGLNPWIVSVAAIVLFMSGILFAWKIKIILNYYNTCRGKNGV